MKFTCTLFLLLFFGFADAQKYDLKFNLVKGASYYHTSTATTTVVQDIDGDKNEITMSISGKMKFVVKEIRDTVYDMDVSYEELNMKIRSAFNNADYSSKDPSEPVSKIYAAMTEKSFPVTMTNKGKIVSLKINGIFEHALEQFPDFDQAKKQQLLQQLQQNFGDKSFSASFELMTAMFPPAPVSKGEKWKITTIMHSMIDLKMATMFQLKNVSDSAYTIDGKCEISPMNPEFVMVAGNMTKYNLAGTMTYYTTIDRATGWIRDCNVNQTLGGTIEVKKSDIIPEDMKVPTSYSTQMKYSGK